MNRTGPLPTTKQILDACLSGAVSREEAMDMLHMSGYAELLDALADRGAAPPEPPPGPVGFELAGAMPVLRMLEAAGHGAGGQASEAVPCFRSDPLRAFARGLLPRRAAIRAAGVRDYAGLLAALGKAGLAPPRAPEREIEVQAALFSCIRGRHATLLIAEDGPLVSLRAAGRLDLLLRLGARVLVPDGVLDTVARDPGNPEPALPARRPSRPARRQAPSDPGDAAIRAFVEAHSPPIAVEKTWAGEIARRRRLAGEPPKTNAGDIALADFMTAGGGIDRYLRSGDPFLVLVERLRSFRPFRAPSNLHLLSTAGLLRGLERVGVIPSADEVLRDMLHPPDPPPVREGRRRPGQAARR